jgi:hypothetical protein
MLSVVLIDYDLQTKEIRRIIVPDHDGQIDHHPAMDGCGRVSMNL